MTREQAVYEHRRMWRWLAEFYAAIDKWNGRAPHIKEAEKIYLSLKGCREIRIGCFCCECGGCDRCPIEWHDGVGRTVEYCDAGGEYWTIWGLEDAKEISEMCKVIAELPERKERVMQMC